MSTGWKLRDDFEAWVNNPHMLRRCGEPGYTSDYDHPWTDGAWTAWQELHYRNKPPLKVTEITKEDWDNACAGLGTKA